MCKLSISILSWLLGQLLVVLAQTQEAYFGPCIFAAQQCPNARISFWLYKNHSQPIALDPLNPTAQLFEPRLPLKILIHGFIGNRSLTPNLEVRDLLLQHQAVHVVSVDYGSLVQWPCYYPWAVQNARIVSKCLAQFIDALLDAGIYTRQQLHLIGFSLGAQVAGMTSSYVRQPLARITALDPAGPGFMTPWQQEKLDSSDADFVDVIHTDPFFFSLLPPMGHVDFYPNLQELNQPGCNYFNGWRFYNCNHYRAAIYYGESIVSERGFWAQHCGGGWLDFFMQRCNQFTAQPSRQMGYFVSEHATGSYFLSTHNAHPFAKGPIIDVEMDTGHWTFERLVRNVTDSLSFQSEIEINEIET